MRISVGSFSLLIYLESAHPLLVVQYKLIKLIVLLDNGKYCSIGFKSVLIKCSYTKNNCNRSSISTPIKQNQII